MLCWLSFLVCEDDSTILDFVTAHFLSFLLLLPFHVSSFCRPLVSFSPMRSDKFSQIHQGSINIFKDSRGVSESNFFSVNDSRLNHVHLGMMSVVQGTWVYKIICFNDSQTFIMLSKRSSTKKVKTNKHSHLFCKKFPAIFHLTLYQAQFSFRFVTTFWRAR